MSSNAVSSCFLVLQFVGGNSGVVELWFFLVPVDDTNRLSLPCEPMNFLSDVDVGHEDLW
jgi:hypothetical protein